MPSRFLYQYYSIGMLKVCKFHVKRIWLGIIANIRYFPQNIIFLAFSISQFSFIKPQLFTALISVLLPPRNKVKMEFNVNGGRFMHIWIISVVTLSGRWEHRRTHVENSWAPLYCEWWRGPPYLGHHSASEGFLSYQSSPRRPTGSIRH